MTLVHSGQEAVIPTEGHGAAAVSVPRDQLVTLRTSLQLGTLLPGEGEALISLWLMIADVEAIVAGGRGERQMTTTANSVGTEASAEVNQTNQVNP